jgi:hypothetical protein
MTNVSVVEHHVSPISRAAYGMQLLAALAALPTALLLSADASKLGCLLTCDSLQQSAK